ncbi:MAG: SDR family oxidoreductase [Oscillospiraceae bacterium]|jgi:NAD(P)-dependent dehydrogenase (short-subunit alcohol dehydrogenase family)|nr:SDR family oxidoreductase [Oscillospiraceae bacterium]
MSRNTMYESPCGPGKAALITGGSRGIGRAAALALVRQGYDVAFTYQSAREAADETKAEIEALGRRCFYYQATMQDADAPSAAVAQATADLGRLDALVTVAGVTRLYPLTETTAERIDEMYACNYRAMLLCAAAAAREMTGRGIRGSIVHIASTHALVAFPTDAVYGGLKSAIVRSTKSEALELAPHGIRVNCVAPGMISVRGPDDHANLHREWAEKVPLGRFGMAREVAEAIAFLVSDNASYITGVTLTVDGGLSLPAMPEDASPEAGYGWGKVR